MHLFGSRGLPTSIRKVNGFGVHTFKMVTAEGKVSYCKLHWRPVDGIGCFTSNAEAEQLAGTNPDFHHEELWNSIASGQFPRWKLYIQIMEPEVAETYGRALLDITKVWPHGDFPLIEVGQMTLNQNASFETPFYACQTHLADIVCAFSRRTGLRKLNRPLFHPATLSPELP